MKRDVLAAPPLRGGAARAADRRRRAAALQNTTHWHSETLCICPHPGLLGERLELPRRLKSSYIRFLFGPWRGRFSYLMGNSYGGC